MKIFGIIPARYGSSRFPGKPLAILRNKPIIQHVYERAKECSLLDDVIVATDDIRIQKSVENFGGKVVMTSPYHQSGTDRIAEVAESLKDVEIIANIQGDEPMISPSAIESAIRPLLNDENLLISTLACKISNQDDINNPNVVKVVFDKEHFALYFSRSPIPYIRDANKQVSSIKHQYYKHQGLYVYRRNFLLTFTKWEQSNLEQLEQLEQLRALENGVRIKIVETEYNSIGIDTPEDIEKAESFNLYSSFL